MVNCAFNMGSSYFLKMKIFTVMYFVEPIVCLITICYLNMYVYSLFANIILLDTFYSLKFLRSCFFSIIRTLYIPDQQFMCPEILRYLIL